VVDAMIRPAQMDDAEALHRYCYPEAELTDVRDYLAWCLRPSQMGRIIRLVAEVNGQVVGNVQLTVWGETGEIGSLVVAPAFRRQGIARLLLSTLITEAQQRDLVSLEIRVNEQEPAILAFYQQLGFRRIPETKEELSHPVSPEPLVHLRMHL
jgi:ribosomal protein S18 acetylase RimI-like enzyme